MAQADIKDFPNYYVTDTGEVWSHRGKKLKGWKNPAGYLQYDLKNNLGFKKHYGHRLIAEAFIPNPNNLPYVCHKDDNTSNNCASNLFWGTHQDNMDDRGLKGRQARGIKTNTAKLTEAQVRDIRSRPDHEGLDREFGISYQHVLNIRGRKSWKHI